MTKFSLYLFEFYPDVQTIYQLDRDIIEEYLIYRKTESKKQKNLTEELKGLKAAFEEFSKIYEDKQFTSLMLNSIREQEAWMKAVPYMEKQVGRAFLLHTLLGTRISEILTLQQDCISKKKGIYWIRIDSTKGRTYSKPITKEIQSLVQASIEYTKKKYGEGRRIFKMAPLHHHFQKPGNAGIQALIQKPFNVVPESKIVVRFWLIGIILAVITIVTLKMR